MNITINSLQLGLGTNYHLASPIEGLGTPPIRTSRQNYSGRDGGFVANQLYAPRLITLTGFIKAQTALAHETQRRTLQNALDIAEALPVTIDTFGNDQYTTNVHILDVQMPITDPISSRFKIDLVANNPYLFNAALTTREIPIDIGGGFILPVTLPAVFGGGSDPTIINNSGDITVYPTITIEGETTNPVITKLGTNDRTELNVTTGVNDTIVIDNDNRTVTLNGSSIAAQRSSDSTWWGLTPGTNNIKYESDDASDTGVCEISWQTAVRSI